MQDLLLLGLSGAAAIAVGSLASLGFRPASRWRTWVLALAAVAILALPWVIPFRSVFVLFLATVSSVLTCGATYAYWRECASAAKMPRPFAWFLVVILLKQGLRHVRAGEPLRRFEGSKRRALLRVALGASIAAATAWLFIALLESSTLESSFLLDHVVKVILLVGFLDALSQALLGVSQVIGYELLPITNFSILARSPADFWRRYDIPVHIWLREYAYLPAGGQAHRVRAVLWPTFVSAVIHEYAFGVSIGAVQGYQLAYFLLQGVGILAFRPLERAVRGSGAGTRLLVRILSWAFLLLTAVLFFASAHQVLPAFYSAEPWLP